MLEKPNKEIQEAVQKILTQANTTRSQSMNTPYKHICQSCKLEYESAKLYEYPKMCTVCSDIKHKELEQKNSELLSKKYIKSCNFCGKEFETNQLIEAKYCSDLCKENYEFAEKEKNQENMFNERIKTIIPSKYLNIDCDYKDLIEKNNEYSLFITGKSGVGKTVLMASLCKVKIRYGQPVMWISYPNFINQLQGLFKTDGDPFGLAREVAQYSGWLAIDDLGAEKVTEYVLQQTYFILNEREQNILPTLITSNYSIQEIAKRMDDRIASRISGICKTLKLSGEDKRIK